LAGDVFISGDDQIRQRLPIPFTGLTHYAATRMPGLTHYAATRMPGLIVALIEIPFR